MRRGKLCQPGPWYHAFAPVLVRNSAALLCSPLAAMVATFLMAPDPEVEGIISGLSLTLLMAESPEKEVPRWTREESAGRGIAPLKAGVRPDRRTLLPLREAASDILTSAPPRTSRWPRRQAVEPR